MSRRYSLIAASLLLAPPVFTAQSANAHQWLNVNKMLVVAQNDIPATKPLPSPPVEDVPMGQASEGSTDLLPENAGRGAIDESLFGLTGGGYVHPFLTLKGEYSDNLFNINENTTSNFLTTITPGIWLAAPQLKEVPIEILSNNTSAGGLQMALEDYKGFDRFNTYLLGSTDLKYYSADSDLNDYGARLEGLFKYNLRGGLSLRAVDRFSRDQDRFDIGNAYATDKLREFNSNVFLSDVAWDFSEKFKAKIDYSNFLLDYKDYSVEFLDRTDNSGSLYGFYKYSVKTSFFLQYQLVDVSYDTSSLRDNTQDFIYGGINWKSTEKTTLAFKAGYQDRDFTNDATQNTVSSLPNYSDGNLALELALQYQIREKTKVSLSLNRKIDESDSYSALGKEIFGAALLYEQEFTEKIHGTCDLKYENADYYQVTNGSRDDDRYVFKPAIQYIFRDWLMLELAYRLDMRNSSDTLYDYDTNIFSISLNTAL